jgi:effector-binding domain-containing protein
MITPPKLESAPDLLVARIHLTVPRAEIRNVMGPALAEVRAALEAQQIAAAGPWLTHHLKRPTDTFDFEVCIPIEREIAPTGRVTSGTLKGGRVVRTSYNGPYEGLAKAWGELMHWMALNGHPADADIWECYVLGPESSDDSAKWQTELNCRVS